MSQKKLKICFFDIENAPHKGMFWDGLFEQNILSVIDYGYPLSFSHKWGDEKTVHAHCLAEYKGTRDAKIKQLLVDMHKVLYEADIVIAHNGDAFDVKKANAYFIRYGLPPLPPRRTVDTKKIAKKYFKFNSNKLDDLGEYLGIGRKIKTGGFDLWDRCMKTPIDAKAWSLMVKYNKQDVILLEKVYKKLLPWMDNHPNINAINGSIGECPNCGSSHIQRRGFTVSGKRKVQRYQCQDCGAWNTESKIILKEQKNARI